MKPSPWKIPLNFLLVLLGFFGLLFTALLLVAMAFFYSPTLFINPETLDYALKQTSVLKSWSWKEAQINHQWIAWNKRRFSGGFDHLCFVYDGPDVNVDTCLDKVSWNVELSWRPDEGFRYVIYEPLVVESSKLVITPKDNQEETPPPDIMKYWGILWSPLIPDVQITLKKVDILKKEKPLSFDLKLVKESQLMTGEALGFSLYATEKKIVISAPKRIQVPYDLKTTNPLYFSHIKLEADILETHIPILLSARVETAEFKMKTDIRRASLRDDLGTPKFVKDVAAATTAELTVGKLKETIYRLARPPFNVLPAPINSMEGQLRLRLICENYTQKDSIQLKLRTELEMTGPKQELNFALNSEIPVMLKDYSFGPITLGLELKKVRLLLPKLSRTKLPPQLIPDSRFKNSSVIVRENLNEQNLPKKVRKTPKQNVDINMHLVALGEKSLHINTNLLDETLKINFDLLIENGEVKKGYVQTFPLTTTIFKRKIVIPSLRVIFNAPLEPQIVAAIEFHLPEYKVKLDLEGPMSNPRQAFSSVPPLPIDDIYSVILFGRPLSGLDPDDRSAAKKSNQILSQGILSLAVLYYFAGSPVESIGYDPSSNELSAQIGLGSKNSLRVGGSGSGLNSAGVRRSLGKGWYIDSSVQRTTRDNGTSGQDYGVLLERIISY